MNFWTSYYERRVPELAREAPFTSKDIDFCGDRRAVRVCAERLWATGPAMTHEELLARITIDPAVCHGKPCIRGRRIWVGLVLGTLEGGMREEEIFAEYPSLEPTDIRSRPLASWSSATERSRTRRNTLSTRSRRRRGARAGAK